MAKKKDEKETSPETGNTLQGIFDDPNATSDASGLLDQVTQSEHEKIGVPPETVPIENANPIFEEIKSLEGDDAKVRDAITQALYIATRGINTTMKLPRDFSVALAVLSNDEVFARHIRPMLDLFARNEWKAKQLQYVIKNLGSPLAAMMLGEVLKERGSGAFGRFGSRFGGLHL